MRPHLRHEARRILDTTRVHGGERVPPDTNFPLVLYSSERFFPLGVSRIALEPFVTSARCSKREDVFPGVRKRGCFKIGCRTAFFLVSRLSRSNIGDQRRPREPDEGEARVKELYISLRARHCEQTDCGERDDIIGDSLNVAEFTQRH